MSPALTPQHKDSVPIYRVIYPLGPDQKSLEKQEFVLVFISNQLPGLDHSIALQTAESAQLRGGTGTSICTQNHHRRRTALTRKVRSELTGVRKLAHPEP